MQEIRGCFSVVNKKAVLSQGNRAMSRIIYSTPISLGISIHFEQIDASLLPDIEDPTLIVM